MGRKKGNTVAKEDTRPFCFFCERKFEDEQVLLQHQRAKHFRCPECDDGAIRGKCESVQGLIVHTLKIHGKALDRVPNAMQGRDNPELNVYGMEGIPLEMLRAKGYATDHGQQPVTKDFVEPPPTNPQLQLAPEAFNPSAMMGFNPQASLGSSMLGAPGLPAPPGMPAASMLGMPGLPAPPGMMAPLGMTAPKPMDSMSAAGLPGLPGLPGMPPGMPHMLSAMPPFSGVGPPAVSTEAAAEARPSLSALLWQDSMSAAAEAQAQLRGTKRHLEEEADAAANIFADEDVSVEELRAQLERYQPGRSS